MKKVLKLIAGFTAGICVIASGFSSVEKYNIIDIGTIVEAEDYTEGTYGLMTYRKYNSYVEITDCDESVTEIEIPAEIDGLPITKIGNLAFENCSKLINIIIPDSVAWIGAKAFYQCRKIEKIRIPDAVTYIGEYAFAYCMNLEDVNIPQGITSIEAHTFSGCGGLKNINIPDSVTKIGDWAFSNCSKKTLTSTGTNYSGITSVSIPDSVVSIGAGAFSSCAYLASITIPDSVTEIETHAFSGCKNLTEFTVPKGIKEIKYRMFNGCDRLSKVTISNNIEKIDDDAFNECYSLTDIYYNATEKQWDLITKDEKGNDYLLNANIHTIGSGYTDELGYIVKSDNTIGIVGIIDKSMTKIGIPSEIEGLPVTSIENDAFSGSILHFNSISWLYGLDYNGENLISITIPNSIKNIESGAFSKSYPISLKDVYYKGTEEEWKNIIISNDYNDGLFNATIHYNSSGEEVTTTTTTDITTTTTTTTTTATTELTPQISQKTLYLSLNDTHKLFMKNTNATPSWKSNDNSIVSISDDGTVTANGVGETSVVATVDNQEFVCNVYILESISYGNLDDNNEISVDDASIVLDMYAKTAAGLNIDTTLNQKASADVNRDGEINVDDASVILSYYAKNAAGMPTTWEELIS